MSFIKSEMLKKLGVLLAVVLVLSYIVYHVASLFSAEIKTVVVGESKEETTVTLDGYLFRDSSPVYSTNTGVADFKISNGDRVAVGDEIARVFEDGSLAESKDMVRLIDNQIALLRQSLDNGSGISRIGELKKSASNAYYSIMSAMAEGTLSGVSSSAKRLLVALNSIEELTNDDFSIKKTIASLESIRSNMLLERGEYETVSANKSGFFYSVTDGHEESFTTAAAKDMSAEEFTALFNTAVPKRDSANLVGKICGDSIWYFVCEMPLADAEKFSQGEYYNVKFTGGDYSIKMSLERWLEAPDGESAFLVFRTNVIPAGFGFERRQTAEVITQTTKGIYIPASAVHKVDHKDSVYILKGSVVLVRRIEIIEKGSDYYVVKDGGPDEADEPYLKSNDLLIISGGNLFDGRILD